MEKPKVDEEKKEMVVIHKGLFYYLFQLVALPFKLIWWVLKFCWRYISIYIGWARECNEYRVKKKHLNKWLTENRLKGEIN